MSYQRNASSSSGSACRYRRSNSKTRCRSNGTKLYWPAVECYRRRWQTTDDDDRRQKASLVCPYTMCRRASNDGNLQVGSIHCSTHQREFHKRNLWVPGEHGHAMADSCRRNIDLLAG